MSGPTPFPTGINVAIALLAPVYWLSAGVPLWPDAAIRVGVGVLVFLLFAGAFYLNVMGGGDVKLAGALALWFTPYETLTLIVIMSIAGGLLTLVVLAGHRAAQERGPSGGSVRRRNSRGRNVVTRPTLS